MKTSSKSSSSTWKQVSELLTVASITKTLSKNPTQTPPQTNLTQTLIHKILSNPSLHISHKLNFFNSNNNIHHSSLSYSLIFNNLCNPKTPFSLLHQHLPHLLHSMKQNGAADGFVGLIEVRCFVFAGIGFVCCYFGWGILCFCFLTVAVSVICQLRGLFNSASVFVWVLRCRLYTAPCIAVLISYVRLVWGALIIYAVSKKKKKN
ncbi:hypothetical protein MtrunA17_Chr7g0220241 [Medicago truncatula]|uniref:Transmembrane protein n=1 Tax=Medicago truncatula TaxID=3880 RepID=A0A396H078_MEDTR|nr:hypothetical protein MtrunA17_Chr7g0220241 [Medicago truncatula]